MNQIKFPFRQLFSYAYIGIPLFIVISVFIIASLWKRGAKEESIGPWGESEIQLTISDGDRIANELDAYRVTHGKYPIVLSDIEREGFDLPQPHAGLRRWYYERQDDGYRLGFGWDYAVGTLLFIPEFDSLSFCRWRYHEPSDWNRGPNGS